MPPKPIIEIVVSGPQGAGKTRVSELIKKCLDDTNFQYVIYDGTEHIITREGSRYAP